MSGPSPRLLGAVFLGGTLGSLARYGVVTWLDLQDGMPWGTLAVNLVGAFLLGVVTALVASGLWRSAVGSGLIGGFTTYSALAVQADELLVSRPATAIAYVLATLVGGLVLSVAGLALGRRWAR